LLQTSFKCVSGEYSELFEKVRCDADQLRAAKLIASQPVVVMSGKGGCGKTEVVSAVVLYVLAKVTSEKYVACLLLVCNLTAVNFFCEIVAALCKVLWQDFMKFTFLQSFLIFLEF